jgi:hypothetical protein
MVCNYDLPHDKKGKPDRYKGFVPGEGFALNTKHGYKGFMPGKGFGLNTNPCGRSWSCATAAMAS